MELYGRVRYAVQIQGLSRREAARRFGIDPRTVAKMMVFSVPPGCTALGFWDTGLNPMLPLRRVEAGSGGRRPG